MADMVVLRWMSGMTVGSDPDTTCFLMRSLVNNNIGRYYATIGNFNRNFTNLYCISYE